jgi:hypothetical protein
MALAKIKNECLQMQVGFNGSGLPLGMRDDIDELALLAVQSQDTTLLALFETIPSEKELLESKGEAFLNELKSQEQNILEDQPVDDNKKGKK